MNKCFDVRVSTRWFWDHNLGFFGVDATNLKSGVASRFMGMGRVLNKELLGYKAILAVFKALPTAQNINFIIDEDFFENNETLVTKKTWIELSLLLVEFNVLVAAGYIPSEISWTIDTQKSPDDVLWKLDLALERDVDLYFTTS